MKSGRYEALAVLAIVGSCTAMLFAGTFFSDAVLAYRDLSRYFYPIRHFVAHAIRGGVLPLWCPYLFAGEPLLAFQQAAVFYPLSALYYCLPYQIAFNLFPVVHYPLAGFGMYLLARRWAMGFAAALLAAIVFAFNGFTVSMYNLPTTLSGMVWLPFILLFFDAALTGRTLRNGMLAGLFFGVSFLGGEPSIAYTMTILLILWTVWYVFRGAALPLGTRVARAGGALLATVVSGCGIAGIGLLPLLEAMPHLDRLAHALPYRIASVWSLAPKDLIDFVVPYMLRCDFSNAVYWREQSWALFIYIGPLVVLALVAAGVYARTARNLPFLAGGAAFFLLLACGAATPLHRLLAVLLPGFASVRYPVRFIYLTVCLLAIIAGYGLDWYDRTLAGGGRRHLVFFRALLALLGGATLLLAVLCFFRQTLTVAIVRAAGTAFSPAIVVQHLANLSRFLGFFIGGGLLWYLGAARLIRRQVALGAFVALVAIDLIAVWPVAHPSVRSTVYREPSGVMMRLMADRSYFRFFVSPTVARDTSFITHKTEEEAIIVAKDRLLANWPVLFRLSDAGGYDSLHLARYRALLDQIESVPFAQASRLLALLNIKYILLASPTDDRRYRFIEKIDAGAYLYEKSDPVPRLLLLPSWRVVPGEAALFGALTDERFDPRREVLIEEAIPAAVMAGEGAPAARGEAGEAAIVRYAANEVVVSASAPGARALVLADAWYPGWRAFVDGRPAKIYRANFVFRAVFLAAGQHTVRFLFDPVSFKLGLALTVTTLALLLGVLAAERLLPARHP